MLSDTKQHNGVYYITAKHDGFSSVYFAVRKKEKRVYKDDVVKLLPDIAKTHPHYQEWRVRKKSTKRIWDYLASKDRTLKILDLGCGNGWFSHQLSQVPKSEVFAVDINENEMEQAHRVFKKPNLKFIYADIFSIKSDVLRGFDIITVNSCIQYFEDFVKITNRLKSKLKSNGELHILDSPFYPSSELIKAKERTKAYYENLGFPEMSKNYFHHKLESLKGFEILYQPKKSIIGKLLREKDSPFLWVLYLKK